MSLKLNSSGGGSVTLSEPVTANNTTLTLPAADGTLVAANASNNLSLTGGLLAAAGLNVSGGGWGVLPYVANSMVIDNNAGDARLFATGANTSTQGQILFYTGTTNGTANERMRIDSSGRIGVGTASPSQKFVVANAGTDNIIMAENTSNAVKVFLQADTSFAKCYTLTNHPLTLGANNTEYARIDTSGNFMVGATSSSSRAYVVTPNNQWAVYSEATSSSLTAGCLALVAARNTTNNTYKAMVYYNSGAGADRFYVTDGGAVYGTGAYNSISDARLKENVRPLEIGLEQVMALQPRRFDWKEGKGANVKDAVGFIAQEVETALPHAVTEWTNSQGDQTTYKAVSMDSMVPVLVKAIQELTAKLDAAEARLDAQTAEIAALKAQ